MYKPTPTNQTELLYILFFKNKIQNFILSDWLITVPSISPNYFSFSLTFISNHILHLQDFLIIVYDIIYGGILLVNIFNHEMFHKIQLCFLQKIHLHKYCKYTAISHSDVNKNHFDMYF